jgi:hypothetical protein
MSSQEKLLALINQDNPNPFPLTLAQVTFSDPVAVDNQLWNTKVTVSSVPGSGYYGDVDVNYKRNSFSELGDSVTVMSELPFTIETIVALLNTTRATYLTVDDIESIEVSIMDVGDIGTVVLNAKSTSLGWLGSVTLTALYGLPMDVDILHILMNHTLPSGGYLT